MAERSYDETIASHYRKVAESAGTSSKSTMLDDVIRARETAAIETFVQWAARELGRDLEVADVGCGNGYTLDTLRASFPVHRYTGFELTPELREIAQSRFADSDIEVYPGDIRENDFVDGRSFDVVISQRVLINLLDPDDQCRALDNLAASVNPSGYLFFIEAFQTSLDLLNVAREEVELEPIAPAHHNLYLGDDFFAHDDLERVPNEVWGVPENDLSTHYFVSRVLAPFMFMGRPFKRNSEIASFFSAALPPGIGDYSPLRIRAYRRLR